MLQQIMEYFEKMPSLQRALLLAGGITFFWIVEGFIPLKKTAYKKWNHAGINIFFTVTTVVVNFALAFTLSMSSEWTTIHKFGIYNWVTMPLWLAIIICLLILDLIGAYTIHFLEHKVKILWRFHLIHHTDINIDATSANRHHPGESVFRAVFTAIAIIVAGAPFAIVMLYQSLSALLSQFNHANISLPKKLDKLISYVIVSPNMHKIHHHYIQPFTNTNYGNIFSLWDRIFGTFVKKESAEIVYGIDTHLQENEHSNIGNLLQMPFQPYRPPTGKFSNTNK